MKLILISDPGKIEGELELVNSFFDSGLEYFHLRKPEYTKAQMEAFLKKINPKFMQKVMLHSHHMLVKKYNIGGFHFPSSFLENEDYPTFLGLIKKARKRRLRTGTSVHSLEEASKLQGFDYYFLSPVFDSISKEGYKSFIELKEIRCFLEERSSNTDQPDAIALGGIDEHNIALLKDVGFSGAAILGAIWKDFSPEIINEKIGKFRSIERQLKQ